MSWNVDQLENAAVIMRVGRELGASERDIQIALMAAIQESSLRNLPDGDRDSVGLFQQRAAWAPYGERHDPAASTRMFFLGGRDGQRGLFDFADRAQMTLTQAAQKVQVSAYPDAYAKHEAAATALMGLSQPDGGPAGSPSLGTIPVTAGPPDRKALYEMTPGVSPRQLDSDDDGLTDEFERLAGTDLHNPDTDGDGTSDGDEVVTGTDPLRGDTDGDARSDRVVSASRTDPGRVAGLAGLAGDADDDGLSDHSEFAAGTDPRRADTDGDDLPDGLEATLGTDPTRLDSDGDGFTDEVEVDLGLLGAPSVTRAAVPGAAVPGAAVPGAAVPGAAVPLVSSPPAASPPAASPSVTAPSVTAPPSTAPPLTAPPAAAPSPGAAQRFLDAALAQQGDRYVFGAVAETSDPDPGTFDCSELVLWAAHQAGVEVQDGATYQYLDLKARGMLIPVSEAVRTPGALLFSFSKEPVPGGGRPDQAHVAISLGDGNTIEAKSPSDSVGVFPAHDRFQYAALIPGLTGKQLPSMVTAEAPHAGPAVATNAAYQITGGMPITGRQSDADGDGLTDVYEQMLGTNPRKADTDGDGLTDAYEVGKAQTNPLVADSDGDLLPDDLEVTLGTDALSIDTDGDGLSDPLEVHARSDPRQVGLGTGAIGGPTAGAAIPGAGSVDLT